jgi:C4-dicarboxylate-specific signal transduction histidine kinase
VQLVRRANEELEHRVEARTAELSAANASLQHEMREREEVEAQLRMAQKLESIGQLAAGIAHEINTPTQYVSDNVHFVETAWSDLGKVIDEYERAVLGGDVDKVRGTTVWDEADVDYLRGEVPSSLREASSGLKQIAKIVKAMKEFSHPGDESLQPADLNRAIESTIDVARNEWKYVAELELDLDAELPLVPCDLSSMKQVMLNIIVNAAQAVGSGLEPGELGHIWISSRRVGDRASILIEDDGPGIPEAIRSQVFDPFFTTKQVGKGTGQGLAIAFRVVQQQHSGTLTVGEGREGRGARFTIELPLGEAPAVQPEVPALAVARR